MSRADQRAIADGFDLVARAGIPHKMMAAFFSSMDAADASAPWIDEPAELGESSPLDRAPRLDAAQAMRRDA
jgi:hypothetical protein